MTLAALTLATVKREVLKRQVVKRWTGAGWRAVPAAVALLLLSGALFRAEAAVVVARVDLSSQRMTVSVNGVPRYSWLVSTARRGYVTPTGVYRPQRLYREYYSRKYYNSPMPYSIFYSGGFAIHGSYAVSQLGGPASHGCIRLHPGNAATLYGLVRTYGPGNTAIVITR
ncbi:L,D-transpeptidase [Xanthobacter autotrophicus]|uniref:L,D-transpeptidase n=1 Tax=Xanthobacter autotrophicus TaxID=280 RepID=UPI003D7F6F99